MRIDEQPLYRGRVFDLFRETHRLPDGHNAEFEIIHHPGGCAVLPLHADGRVTLLRQYRPAAGKVVIEIPAGRLEVDETPLACVRRELAEEAGLTAATIEPLGSHFAAIGYSRERIALFVATQLDSCPPAPEADEWIEPFTLPLVEALQAVKNGEIDDAKTQLALLLCALDHGVLA